MRPRAILAVSVTSGENKIPSLDGMRAVSIVLVLAAHATDTLHLFPVRILEYTGEIGLFGVKIFFVISGFLITTLLLRERERTGAISLLAFYLRRILRILPAYYVFLLVSFLLAHAGFLPIPRRNFLHALTFTANLAPMSWQLLHLWSLSAEEQFYLLWPLGLVLAHSRASMRTAAISIVAAPLICGLVLHAHTRLGEAISALAAGCVLAGLHPRLAMQPSYRRLLTAPATPPLLFMALLIVESLRRFSFFQLLVPFISVAIAMLVDAVITTPHGAAGKVLNAPKIAYLGTLSYSLYLWQQLFLNPWGQRVVSMFPLNLLCTAACALASFYLVERPFLRWKTRFEPRRSNLSEKLAC